MPHQQTTGLMLVVTTPLLGRLSVKKTLRSKMPALAILQTISKAELHVSIKTSVPMIIMSKAYVANTEILTLNAA